ncbi:diguanylate cyclase (GGDEF)-like protein/PAS domain S-box-containing protein [Oxalobacteraceae bacterium GrIS 1.11]
MSRTRLTLLPLLILAAALGVTWALWEHERQAARHELQAQFDGALRDTVGRIEQRMGAYEQMLLGVRGLQVATGQLEADNLRDYVAALHLDANFFGVQAIGVAQWRPAAGGSATIVQREPRIAAGRSPVGIDAWSEPARRTAMEKARDSGMAAISAKVSLRVDAGRAPQAAFIMYLPLYARGQAQDSVAQRRAHLAGWVFAAVHVDDLMASLYGEQAPGLALAIYDGIEPSERARLHAWPEARGPALLAASEYLVLAGHTWLLSLSAHDAFQARFGRNAQWPIGIAGCGLSLLLALLAWLMTSGRGRAMRLAAAMTTELRASEEKFRAIADCTVNWEVWWGLDGKPRWINSSVRQYTGYTVDECMAMPDFIGTLVHADDVARVTLEFQKGLRGLRGDDLEFRCRRKDGAYFWLSVSWVPISDARGVFTGFRTSGRDITERKKAEKKIEELAFFDALTDLPNRTLLLDRLKQAMTAGARSGALGAVLFIDLDHFKTLNDTLGHDQGDLLLQQVARRLSACLREGDTVARLGGDEFVVVLEGLSGQRQEAANQTEALGEKILATLNRGYRLGTIEYRSTASVGATLFAGHAGSIDDLLKQADLAMYQAKESGRNALRFFDPAMQTAVIERAALEADLRLAIESEQFVLHYQAQVAGAHRVTGAEALLRWQHPRRGMVAPADFIGLAEETGLILPLGLWVLRSACLQLALWAARPELAHLCIAVNVSARQFRAPDFVATVLGVLGETGANGHRLKLELTESLLVDNVQDIIEKMLALKAEGVGFALDDFGTGYSSFSYLKRLPLDQLKIDQSFVRDVLIDPNDAAIARTIVALAQSLGLGVIAEGVETRSQRDFLASSGCHAYQGYLYSRPLPLSAFEHYASGVQVS